MIENIDNISQLKNNRTELADNFNNQPVVKTISKKNNAKMVLIILGLLIFVFTISVSAYYLGTQKQSTSSSSTIETVSINKTPTKAAESTPILSGQIQRLNQNLKLFKIYDAGNGIVDNAVYYSAGVFNIGELKDYTRIIAIQEAQGPGYPSTYILATKDFQTFILNDPNNDTAKPENDWQNPYSVLDKTKITSTKNFDTEQTNEISLDQKFSLYFQNFSTETSETNKVDKYGNKIYESTLITDFSSYQKLTSPVNNLTFYFKPYKRNEHFDQFEQGQKNNELIKEKYFSGDTSLMIVDSTGLPLNYLLTTTENIKSYQQKNAINDISLKDSVLPSFTFTSSAIENNNNLQFYKTYATAIPGGCSMSLSTRVISVSDNDLEQIGKVSNTPIYRLKDKKHSLYKLAFDNKMEYYNLETTSSEWEALNKGIKKPTLEEYINNNPLLFIKDYWQRWVALGEYDIQLPGGCGKPVVYLYPTKPTEVSVKFNSPVQFTTDIPKYNDSWQVLAQPNGSLKNLKSNDCSQINFTKRGSEYAADACRLNNYPYLFWAGNIYSQKYPSVDKGWIVEKNNLNKFLNSKLSEMNLNSKEKDDFINYWLPEMEGKNAPFYRISFLQTNELNYLFPMTITPKPDTVFRIFLDYSPLSQKPDKILEPQSLNKLTRQGFTLVEWGGIKK